MLLDPTEQLLAIMWAVGYTAQAGGIIDDSFFLDNPEAAEYASTRAGALIADIDEWTRTRIRQVLTRIYEDPSVTVREVENAINDLFGGFSESRALTIARTEMAYAEGWGSSSAWRGVGVEYVSISDGIDNDVPCAEANGQIWPLWQYEMNIIEHPNCTRAASPLLAEEVNPDDVTEE